MLADRRPPPTFGSLALLAVIVLLVSACSTGARGPVERGALRAKADGAGTLPDGVYLVTAFNYPQHPDMAKTEALAALPLAKAHGYPAASVHIAPLGTPDCEQSAPVNGKSVSSCGSAIADQYLLVLEGPFADAPSSIGQPMTEEVAQKIVGWYDRTRPRVEAEARTRGLPFQVSLGYFAFSSGRHDP